MVLTGQGTHPFQRNQHVTLSPINASGTWRISQANHRVTHMNEGLAQVTFTSIEPVE